MEPDSDIYYCEICGVGLPANCGIWQEEPFAFFCDDICQNEFIREKELNEVSSDLIQEK